MDVSEQLYCPFEPGLNPDVEKVQRWSVAWARQLSLLDDERKYQHLSDSRISWLVARAYHDAPVEILQLAADWTTLFCMIDDRVEKSTLGPLRLAGFLNRLLEAFRCGSYWNWNEPIAHALVDLRRRMLDRASVEWVEAFGDHLEDLFTGYPWEAIHRDNQITPDVETYRKMRLVTIGLRPLFHFASLIDGANVPEELRSHPFIKRLEVATCNAVGWANDIFTYEKEIQDDEVNNLVFSLRDSLGISLSAALQRAVMLHNDEIRLFEALEAQVPDFGDATEQVMAYVGILKSWVRGHLDWGVETGRYRPQAEFPREAPFFDPEVESRLSGRGHRATTVSDEIEAVARAIV